MHKMNVLIDDHARENAKLAGVDHLIHFQTRPVNELSHPKKYGFLITNPPYGERLFTLKEAEDLYRNMGKHFKKLDKWQIYVITSHEEFGRLYGRKPDKVRKLYNGMIPCYFYQFFKNN